MASKKLWLAVFVLGAGCGPARLEVPMNAQNNSAQSGTAVLVDDGQTLTVTLELAQGVDTGEQPAHIHNGDCAALGSIFRPLSNVVQGASVTELTGLRLDELVVGSYAINVHSSQNITTYVSCGQLRR